MELAARRRHATSSCSNSTDLLARINDSTSLYSRVVRRSRNLQFRNLFCHLQMTVLTLLAWCDVFYLDDCVQKRPYTTYTARNSYTRIMNAEHTPSSSPIVYQSRHLLSSPQDPPFSASLPFHLAPFFLLEVTHLL